jgi:hypothetical protein
MHSKHLNDKLVTAPAVLSRYRGGCVNHVSSEIRFWDKPGILSEEFIELFTQGVKRQVREADHLLQTSAEVKITWIYTSTPTYNLMAWCLIN